MGEYNLSASKIKKHSQCPRAFWYSYKGEKEPTKGNTEYLDLGSRVHGSIENVLTSEECPPLERERTLVAAIQNEYREMEGYEIPDDLYDTGLACCQKAAEYLSAQQPDIQEVELWHEFDIDRDDMVTGVTAKIDIVTESEIWDWKTGSIRDDSAHDERIQGSIYIAAYYNKYGEIPDCLKFVYVKEGNVRKLNPDDKHWNYMIKHAKGLLRSEEQGVFQAKPGDACYWCDYEFWCDASPVGMGDVDINEW